MNKWSIVGLFLVGFFSHAVSQDVSGHTTQTLMIRWQRLTCTKDSTTCERCSNTQEEIVRASDKLKEALGHLGIEVILKEEVLDEKTFARSPQESNRIWIGEKSLEEWLKAKIGKSSCVSCCELLSRDIKCRTIKYEGKTYESIPANLIIKAGLIAAARLLKLEADKPCCGDQAPGHVPCESCPNK